MINDLVQKLLESAGPVISSALALVVAGLAFAGARQVVKAFKGFASKTENKIDDKLAEGLEEAVENAEEEVRDRLPKR